MGDKISLPEAEFLPPVQELPGAEAERVAVQEAAPETFQAKEMLEESFLGTAKGEPEVVSCPLTLRSTVGGGILSHHKVASPHPVFS